MRDLFLKLGLDPAATSAEILEAVEAKPEHAAAAEILLNERRRAPYQRTVSTLRSIGLLRHRLGLDNDNTWFVESCPDFAPRLHGRKFYAQPPVTVGAAADPAADGHSTAANVSPAKSTTPETGSPIHPWLKPGIIVLAIVAILLLLTVIL